MVKVEKTPKYMEKKIERLEKLLFEANSIRTEVEDWLYKQGIDYVACRERNIFDDSVGCGYGISLYDLNNYLNSKE